MTGKPIEAFGRDASRLDGEATKAAVCEADAPTASPMNKTVEVSQGARDAAADAFELANPVTAQGIRDGAFDDSRPVQAFARFEATIRTTPSTDAVREAVGREEQARELLAAEYENATFPRVSEMAALVRSGAKLNDQGIHAAALRAVTAALQLADTRTTQPDSALREAVDEILAENARSAPDLGLARQSHANGIRGGIRWCANILSAALQKDRHHG